MSQTLCKTPFECPPARQMGMVDLDAFFRYDRDDPANPHAHGKQNRRRMNRTLKARRRMAKRNAA